MANRYVEPSIDATAFNCPYCGVLTTQYWFAGSAQQILPNKNKVPDLWSEDKARQHTFDPKANLTKDDEEGIRNWFQELAKGEFHLEGSFQNARAADIQNLNFSKCYNCS